MIKYMDIGGVFLKPVQRNPNRCNRLFSFRYGYDNLWSTFFLPGWVFCCIKSLLHIFRNALDSVYHTRSHMLVSIWPCIYFFWTGRYMAPEIFRNEEYDTKVDVFSFSLILQEVLLGQLAILCYISIATWHRETDILSYIGLHS